MERVSSLEVYLVAQRAGVTGKRPRVDTLQRSREFWIITVVVVLYIAVVVVVLDVVVPIGDAVARVIPSQVAPAERVCIAFELKFDCETKRIENTTHTQSHTHTGTHTHSGTPT